MGFVELFLIGVGLSMDAFAVSICKGLSMKKCTWRKTLLVGAYFGIFQAGMPLIGYFLGRQFKDIVESVDHWIAFALLALIGLNMLREAFEEKNECECCAQEDLAVKTMLGLAVATSIDALAVGVAFSMQEVRILPAVLLIGTTTFFLSGVGVKIGHAFGGRYQKKAEIVGGLILIILGLKILLEDLHIL